MIAQAGVHMTVARDVDCGGCAIHLRIIEVAGIGVAAKLQLVMSVNCTAQAFPLGKKCTMPSMSEVSQT
jgi:hypothetical protein